MSLDDKERMFGVFGEAARLASIYELRLRILADKSKHTKNVSMSKYLEDVEQGLFLYFDDEITPEEKGFLIKCRKLRNKLFHSEFSTASSIIEEIFGVVAPDIVKGIKIPDDLTGEQILEKIFACASGEEPVTSVLDTTERESGIYGWLLQIYNSGLLFLSVDAFRRSINIINRLIELNKND